MRIAGPTSGFARRALLLLGMLCLAPFPAQAATEAEVLEVAKQAAGGIAPARERLERMAGEGEALAAHMLGVLHLRGQGVPRDEALALDWFAKAAKLGRADSAHNVGVIYERSSGSLKDPAEARGWYRIAAGKGHAGAQANLGNMLAEGIGGAADPDEARAWIEKAVAQGEPRGYYLLGRLALEGRAGIAKDPAAAEKHIRLAAEKGDRDAQYELSRLLGTGLGMEKNVIEALDWLRKAADQRHPEAEFRLGVAYARGVYNLRRDEAAAVNWLRRSARQDHIEAMVALGYAYAEGRGVPRDATEAYGWMLEASRKGSPEAIEFVRRIQAKRPPPDSAPPPDSPPPAAAPRETRP